MTWPQVVEMAQSGMEISSHTVSHPILSQLDDQSLKSELTESQRIIREKTGQASRTLCYPVGMEIAFDERVIAAARLADYALGISYLYGGNQLSTLAPYAVRRLHVERYTSRDRFVAQLLLPNLMS
jgi:peptidoglycan/xylan/chitin deacetylase (PgdA/CDA1 family)